ncbi:MAG: dCTP deaminase [Thermoplasmata archaeon]|nr:MAG: dCTP deaminase [Thermoplasmata archaeon]
MFLGKKEIINRIKNQNLIENFDENNIQGAGVDLEIEELHKVKSGGFIGINNRILPELEKESIFIIKPMEYYLCITKEKVNMPNDLVAFIFPRSTLFRCGVSLKTAVVDPGYKGRLTMGIKNESKYEFKLERYARIAQIVFCEVKGETSAYSGRYQGGRII